MNNNNALRKTLIIALAVFTLAVIAFLIFRSMNTPRVPSVEDTEPAVEIKSAPELIADQKFSILDFDGSFSESIIEVPLGGILQLNNNTDAEVMLVITQEHYSAAIVVPALETTFSPVFTEKGEYMINPFENEQINSEVRAKIIVN